MSDSEKVVYGSAIALLAIEYGSCCCQPVCENVETLKDKRVKKSLGPVAAASRYI